MLKMIDTEAVESPSQEVVQRLANSIAGRDKHWFIDLEEFLVRQSEATLNTLVDYTAGYTDLCWKVLSEALHTYVYDGSALPDNTHLVPDGVSQEVFFLNLAFSLPPLAAKHHEPMIGEETVSYDGERDLITEDEMLEHASDSMYEVMRELLPDEESIRMVRACYMITLYGRRGEVPLPSGSDFLWLADHAMETMDVADAVFPDGEFDRELAENLLNTTESLREGVL